jgi:hypothetical protein
MGLAACAAAPLEPSRAVDIHLDDLRYAELDVR